LWTRPGIVRKWQRLEPILGTFISYPKLFFLQFLCIPCGNFPDRSRRSAIQVRKTAHHAGKTISFVNFCNRNPQPENSSPTFPLLHLGVPGQVTADQQRGQAGRHRPHAAGEETDRRRQCRTAAGGCAAASGRPARSACGPPAPLVIWVAVSTLPSSASNLRPEIRQPKTSLATSQARAMSGQTPRFPRSSRNVKVDPGPVHHVVDDRGGDDLTMQPVRSHQG